ncbi:MAG TPA: cupin domain-containing protein [Thermoanaerobaculia bacterium]|nr:cupin domain-containing protein [Thermoanaerobaculia bacterium]
MTELTTDDLNLLDRVAAQAIDPVAPPAAVRAKVMDAIRNVPGAHESRTVRAEEGTWKTVAPGARMKVLSKEGARMTFLLELDPHATVPAHDHEGGEDSYVIRGSCRIGALGLDTGDFHHADATAHHGDVVASADGCLLLLTLTRAA